MKFLEVKIIYESDDIKFYKKIISNIFYDMGVTGLKFEETDFIKNPLDYYKDERQYISNNNSISAYFPVNIFIEKRKKHIIEIFNEKFKDDENIIYIIDFYESDDEDFQNSWKKYLFVERVGENFVIKPTWRDYEIKNNEHVIEIDPGRAFGTGSHPTTSLCIKAMEKINFENKSVIDIGTGSGILMIVAKKLGAKKIYGIDIDENSIESATENLKLNNINLDENIKVFKSDLLKLVEEEKKFDFIVANILSDVLINLIKDIKKITKQNSQILFSGIIKDKLDLVKTEIENNSFKIIDIKNDKEWYSILFEC